MRHRRRVEGVPETRRYALRVGEANERAAAEAMDRVLNKRRKSKDVG